MIDVWYGPASPSCAWPAGSSTMRVRALDVARAAALTLTAGPGRSLTRRLTHLSAVALEVIAHLRNDTSGNGLHAIGLDGLDATARGEVVHRIGVGLARVIAERSVLGLVDFYNLDALASDPTSPVTIARRRPRSRRRPDFAGRDATGAWNLIEAKGRAGTGTLRRARRDALDQVQAVDLQRADGTSVAVKHRVACVTRLGTHPLAVFADDPPADEVRTIVVIDELELLSDYYALARDLVAQTPAQGPGLSGAEDFTAIAFSEGLILGIHRALIPVLDDPEQLATVRAELQEEFTTLQGQAEEAEDVDLSIGRDGLALASRTANMQDLLGGVA